jgi:uncharacterized protein (TIGR02145 family)
MKKYNETFTDPRDGKVYKIIEIGGQVWFAENLNFAAEGSVCYENDEANGDKYGRLYNWETALKACPDGWRLPSDEEWSALVDYAGGEETAGTKLKSTSGWNSYNGVSGNGTDEYGFSALPGGGGLSDGNFLTAGNFGFWWSATEYRFDDAFSRGIDFSIEYVYRIGNGKSNLFSVRCVKD